MLNRLQPGLCLAVTLACLSPAFAESPQGNYHSSSDFWGPRYQRSQAAPSPTPKKPSKVDLAAAGRLRHWNETAVNASGFDHTLSPPQQGGPVRAARAMAIVHIAVFEAINAIDGHCISYLGVPPVKDDTSMNCAIAQAAHDTLCALFPAQVGEFDDLLSDELAQKESSHKKKLGIALGKDCAAKALAMRANDGSAYIEQRYGFEYIAGNEPGIWRQDPISQHPLALGSLWGQVAPFVLQSSDQFRCPVPPALNSAEYTDAYNEVKALGGDGIITPTIRTAEQTEIGTFWAYDGTPSLCAPPRLYNQITMHIADQMGTSNDPEALARLLALVNTALADAGVASWESKFFYKYWRPITAIRESDINTGPTGFGDGNDDTAGDINFTPLGAPASNLNGPNFTPPFPAYPSGHATFGGSLFQTLRRFYGTDNIPFTFQSDEFNGVTRDNAGNVRPVLSRSYANLSQAEEENGQSRIYLGIHWKWDKEQAIAQGQKVADWVFDHAFQAQKKKPKPPKK